MHSFSLGGGEFGRVFEEEVEHAFDAVGGETPFEFEGGDGVDVLVEESLHGAIGQGGRSVESGEALGVAADGLWGIEGDGLGSGGSAFDEGRNEEVDEAAEDLLELDGWGCVGELGADFVEEWAVAGDRFGDIVEGEEASGEPIVEVGGIVGDFVGEVDELGFERGAEGGEELVEFGRFAWGEVA